MKFMKYILIVFALFEFTQLKHFPSQSTRNYRKGHPDPSYNPLPNKWETGPRNNLPLQHPYEEGKNLHHAHSYKDKSTEIQQKAARRAVWQ